MKISFNIGESVTLKTKENGVVVALELVSPLVENGLGIHVANTMEGFFEKLSEYEATEKFTLRYGIRKTSEEKIRFYFEESIIGGIKHPFGKGSL